jgi:hypothetical protein
MTEEQINENVTTVTEELELAKTVAKMLKIKHSPNIALSTLQEKITTHLKISQGISTEKTNTVSKDLFDNDDLTQLNNYQKLNRLVRVKVYNLDSSESYKKGDIFTFNNAWGSVTKFVPYGDNCGEGYHIPKVFLPMLTNQTMALYGKVQKGQLDTSDRRKAPKYNIVLCPPLTDQQLEELKQRQIATRAIDQTEEE